MSIRQNLSLTDADLISIERELCARSLAHFAKRAWHVLEPATPLKWGWALDAICEHLEAVTFGHINRLLMNVPPGTMKSLLTGVIWPAWEWGPQNMPEMRFVGTAHEEQLAIRDSRRCRDLIKSAWYQKLWPIKLLSDLDGKREFGNTRKGIRQARAFTSMTGVRGDRCLVGNTKIATTLGLKTIQEIVITAEPCYVLGYDEYTQRVVQRPIEAVARRASSPIYRVHTASGRMADCTEDHQWYTQRGYIETRFLSESDAILHAMQPTVYSNGRGNEKETTRQRRRFDVLQSILRHDLQQFTVGKNRPFLQHLWQENGKGAWKAAVLATMPIPSTQAVAGDYGDAAFESAGSFLRRMWQADTAENKSTFNPLLLSGMQAQGAFQKYERQSKSWLAWWHRSGALPTEDTKPIQSNKAHDSIEGSMSLCDMPFTRQVVSSSYRFQCDQQRSYQLGDVVSSMPYNDPFGGTFKTAFDPVVLVEDLHRSEIVYDIQVAHTHNFFANGLLSHNCLLDDPVSADNANSAAKLEAARIAFTETLPTRVNSDQSAIIVIMQRLNEKDVSGVILDMQLPYVHLCIPMRYESEHKCRTQIGWEDPRSVDGELMFPERFSEDQVKELEKTLGNYGTAGQLQQRPSPRGGGIINISWFGYWQQLTALDFRFITADTAQKTETHNDWSVLQCWGRTALGKAILLDQIRGRWEAPELLVNARAFWIKQLNDPALFCKQATLRGMYVEDKVSGTGLIQTLRREGMPVLAIQRNKDKIARCYDAAPFIESGNVLLPQDAPYLSELLAEIEVFPAGVHDDQLDPLFDAINLVQSAPAIQPLNAAPMPTVNRWK